MNESLGYAGCMWEPEYSEEELFERLSDTDDGGDIGHARNADLTWCTCSFCASLYVPINSYGHCGMATLFPGHALTSA